MTLSAPHASVAPCGAAEIETMDEVMEAARGALRG